MVNSLAELLSNPLFWKIIASYWIFNAIIAALPAPTTNKFYKSLFIFLHTLGGNLDRAATAFHLPGA